MLLTLLQLFLCTALFLPAADSKNWAVLVAGSNGWANYRHQADICHAYRIMRQHGIAEENIITMMYDDIAFNRYNPYQGNIINWPNGPNLYPEVVIDYRKDDVNPDVFLAVMRGDEEAVKNLTGHAGKVLKSGPEDHVFVNLADHGGFHLFGFPTGKLLHRHQLLNVINEMHTKKMYKEMVFYVEACLSGSLFNNALPSDLHVYAETAANPREPSYVDLSYFDKVRQVFLGDLYSVNWMEDSDKENLKKETIEKQYLIAKKKTTKSHVMQYGDMAISNRTVGEFQGSQRLVDTVHSHSTPLEGAVPATEVELYSLYRQLEDATTLQEKRNIAQEIENLMNHRAQVDQLFMNIVQYMKTWPVKADSAVEVMDMGEDLSFSDLSSIPDTMTQWQCYQIAVDTLSAICPNMKLHQNYRALGHLPILANLCERGYASGHICAAVSSASRQDKSLCGE